jgi:hypothetical protein
VVGLGKGEDHRIPGMVVEDQDITLWLEEDAQERCSSLKLQEPVPRCREAFAWLPGTN